jgi:hypothetical protein
MDRNKLREEEEGRLSSNSQEAPLSNLLKQLDNLPQVVIVAPNTKIAQEAKKVFWEKQGWPATEPGWKYARSVHGLKGLRDVILLFPIVPYSLWTERKDYQLLLDEVDQLKRRDSIHYREVKLV